MHDILQKYGRMLRPWFALGQGEFLSIYNCNGVSFALTLHLRVYIAAIYICVFDDTDTVCSICTYCYGLILLCD